MKNYDFFSKNPPLTLFEKWQVKNGLRKFLRPKDMAVKQYLDKLDFRKAKNILDYGCANGVWLERVLKETKAKGVGVDIAGDLINIASHRKGRKGDYYDCSKNWPVKDGSIDFCFSFDVFEHLRDRESEIIKLSRAIKKGGKILIFTLNPNNKYTFDWLFESLGSDWLYKRSDHLKSRFISPTNLARELKNYGFKNVGFELYPGPLNLFWDVFCYGFLKTLELLIGKNIEKILNLNSCCVKFIFSNNLHFDKFVNNKGYSNGYFIWAQK